jgi:hypothetical protein
VAWSLCKADVSGDHGIKDLVAKEVLQVVANLVREVRSLIKHGQQNSLDCQLGVMRAANPNESVKEL